MDGTDFYYKRRGLGLTQAELAGLLDVAERTVRRWEKNEMPIPDGAAADLNDLHAAFGERVLSNVDSLIEQWEQMEANGSTDTVDRVVEIASFKTPQSQERAHPGESWEYHKALISTIGTILAGEGYRVRFNTVTEEDQS